MTLEAPAEELIDSLVDELALPPWGRARSLVGSVALIVVAALRPSRPPTRLPEVLYVSNVPHGRLGAAATHAAKVIAQELPRVVVVADRRLADAGVCVQRDFPGLGFRSLVQWADRGTLRAAWRGVRLLRSQRSLPRTSRVAVAYLLVAQCLRYDLAARMLVPHGVLVTDFDRGSYAAPLVHAARETGWVTATTVHGSLNPSTYFPFRAEHVLVWGQAQAEMAERHGAMVHLVGRSDLLKADQDVSPIRRVLICESGEDLSAQEEERLVRLCKSKAAAGAEIVIRRHPRWKLLGERSGWRAVSALGETTVATGSLTADLRAGDLVVGISSTALVDALMSGHQVASLADKERVLPADLLEVVRRQSSMHDPAARSVTQQRIVCASGSDADSLLRATIRRLATEANISDSPAS